MNLSYKWLKKHINISSINIKNISNIMTSIGLEVESFDKDLLIVNITPNRSDAMSHYGVARDLYAILKYKNYDVNIISHDKYLNNKNYINNQICNSDINLLIKDFSKCIRYTYLVISNIKVTESPIWIKDMLQSIGILPVNNIIDVCNFIMYDLGQPIYAFDIDKINNKKIKLSTNYGGLLFDKTDITTRIIDKDDLLLNSYDNEPIFISGILSNKKYIIDNNTKNIYIESACYNPKIIRKTANRHHICNDSSLRFERGVDPNMTLYAIYKIIYLLKKITNVKLFSYIKDIYPYPIKNSIIKINLKRVFSIIGKAIPKEKILKILNFLNIKVINDKNQNFLKLIIPIYRNDIKEEIDVVEEILRIYGYNNIKCINKININCNSNNMFFFSEKLENTEKNISNFLVSNGYYEIMSNSINNNFNYKNNVVYIKNPLNDKMKEMRSNLLDNMLNCVSYNIRRKNFNIKIFEWGKIFFIKNESIVEKLHLSIINSDYNNNKSIKNSFFYIKNIVEKILQISGIIDYKQIESKNSIMQRCLTINYNNINIINIGNVKTYILKKFNIYQDVLFADICWETIKKIIPKNRMIMQPISKYPGAKRDLSILIDKSISYEEIYRLAININKDIIKNIKLFDLYEDKSLPKNKKSYGLSFYLQDINATLTDLVIDNTINDIKKIFKEKLKVEFR